MSRSRDIADIASRNADNKTGLIAFFATSAAPDGWLECNGAAVSRTTYADLFAEVGTDHGAGDGTTTFNLPDLRGEFIRGWDNGRGVDSGRARGSAQAGEVQSHNHATDQVGGVASGTAFNAFAFDGAPANTNRFTRSTGGTETRPRNIALLGCIKT